MDTGDRFNESETFTDPATGRRGRRLSTQRPLNQTPTYHYGAAFSADSRYLIFATVHEGGSAILRAEVATGELAVVATAPAEQDEGGFTGMQLTMAPSLGVVAASKGRRQVVLYDLESFEPRTLLGPVEREQQLCPPAVSPEGDFLLVNRVPANHFENPADYHADCLRRFGGMPSTCLRIRIADGAVEEVFHEPVAGSNHIQICPTDKHLWLLDRDWPPKFAWGGDHGRTSRCWLWCDRDRRMIEVRPRDPNRFQIHTNFSHDGRRIYYHGRSLRAAPQAHAGDRVPTMADFDGQYIGVADTTGQVLWEYWIRGEFHYGHVSTHPQAEAIITDGMFTPDHIVCAHYTEAGSEGEPPLETLARHATAWGRPPGQWSHPHPHLSPDGRWLCYNRSDGERTDVVVVDMAH